MPREEENYVALFIDWDNLAISTAVDFAGAVPDVRAIVRAAQRSGTVLLARAYAEWNVSSDRLSVYRAGIEPVYAPTFRFEPEPGSQMPRGKSLADPCLVTDCIDTLHLMPDINVFVLVSGDKDMIPIVRLAQLRGKRVVVIGPDFVAAILREMADEYIPYRVLAESSETPPSTEVSLHGPRGQRRMPAANARATSLPAAPTMRPQTAPQPMRTVPPPISPKPVAPEVNGNGSIEETVTAATIAEPPVVATPIEEGLDTTSLFETIGSIVREREQAGKPKLRATNLKDQLLARIPGFNERRYGFVRFKDLLAAAEKAGVLVVSRTGPVQWVAAVPPATPPPVPVVPTESVPPVTSPPPVQAPVFSAPSAPAVEAPAEIAATPVAPTADVAPAEDNVDADVVRYILDLRQRSRWLTYTYLLTNLLNHLGKGSADAAADAAARTTLNRLVQSGVLIVDREPREIDVNGTRHRVRLCHIVDEHPLVESIRAQMAAEAAADAESGDATATVETATEAPVERPQATVAEAASEPVASPEVTSAMSTSESTEPPAPRFAAEPQGESREWRQSQEVASGARDVAPVGTASPFESPIVQHDESIAASESPVVAEPANAPASDWTSAERAVEPQAPESLSSEMVLDEGAVADEVAPPSRSAETARQSDETPAGEPSVVAQSEWVVREESAPPAEAAASEGSFESASTREAAEGSTPTETQEETSPAELASPPLPTNGGNGNGNGHGSGSGPASSDMTLADSYQVLREVVREATGPNRPSTGPAAVKNRLVRRLGAFDEHAFGFSKFKDYLLSAERAGAVKVELVGTSARVSLPTE